MAFCGLLLAPLLAVLFLGGGDPPPKPAVRLRPQAAPREVLDPEPVADDVPSTAKRPLVVTVLGDDGALAGAEVRIVHVDGGEITNTGRTDAAGAYRTQVIPSTPLDITVSADGFASRTVAFVLEQKGALEVRLSQRQPAVGRVLGPSGDPVKNALIVVKKAERCTPTTITTDKDGRFEIEGGRVGCEAEARHRDFAPSASQILKSGDGNTFRLSEGARLVGALNFDGKAARGARVVIESFRGEADGPSPVGRAATFEDDGMAFRFEGLPPGTLVILGAANGVAPVRSEPITLADGEYRRDVVLRLEAGVAITGTVVNDEGEPLPGVSLRIDAIGFAGSKTRATTDAAGAFSLAGAPAAGFSIAIRKKGYQGKVMSFSDVRDSPMSLKVELSVAKAGVGMEFTGIGASLAPLPGGGVKIARVFAGAGAHEAGVLVGDVVVRIDSQDARHFSMNQVISLLRGPVDTRVTISVQREGQTKEFLITRAKFNL